MQKYTIAFVCVHNSCRSQMAEAIAKLKHDDFFIPSSAGTHPKEQINPQAVEYVKKRYGVDMSETQKPKLLEAIDNPDLLITMGCNVECPYIPTSHREDWNLDDPSGKDEAAFQKTADAIENNLAKLRKQILEGTLKV